MLDAADKLLQLVRARAVAVVRPTYAQREPQRIHTSVSLACRQFSAAPSRAPPINFRKMNVTELKSTCASAERARAARPAPAREPRFHQARAQHRLTKQRGRRSAKRTQRHYTNNRGRRLPRAPSRLPPLSLAKTRRRSSRLATSPHAYHYRHPPRKPPRCAGPSSNGRHHQPRATRALPRTSSATARSASSALYQPLTLSPSSASAATLAADAIASGVPTCAATLLTLSRA